MHRSLLRLLAFALFAGVAPARAIDPGTASGTLVIGDDRVQLTHAYAYMHEIAPRDTELRVALVDRAIAQESIAGEPPLPIEKLALKNGVRGLLLRYDPEARRDSSVLALDSRTMIQDARAPRPIPRRTKLLEDLRIESHRVRGELDGRFDAQLQIRNVRFSAPLFHGRRR